ncbi:hypothetical protein [Foetidibacter luteolus]|uniref:hypothetical protein n=1 Tax=Foetidibacter luteolus TaxID=2608880 RepID=UPI00129AAE68|nr:hypothetical protein [Foetidibacter luteolus]
MKKPIKPVLCTVLLTALLSAGQLKAQRLVFIFGHLTYNTPVQSNLKDNYRFGAGAEAGVGIGRGQTFLTATTGYTKFNSKSGSGVGNFGYVPVKLGLRQYVVGKLLFLNANAGMAVIKPKDADNMSRFTADVGVGAQLLGLDLSINYDGFAAKDPSGWASWIAFKAGFRFGL